MRSHLMTAVVVSAAIALGGCPKKRPHPVPGPQSAPTLAAAAAPQARDEHSQSAAVSEIARSPCTARRALLRL